MNANEPRYARDVVAGLTWSHQGSDSAEERTGGAGWRVGGPAADLGSGLMMVVLVIVSVVVIVIVVMLVSVSVAVLELFGSRRT